MAIILRQDKGSRLTTEELDGNFQHFNDPFPRRKFATTRVLNDDTCVYEGIVHLTSSDFVQYSSSNLYYYEFKYKDDNDQIQPIDANFGYSFNVSADISYVSTEELFKTFDIKSKIISNIRYVESNKTLKLGIGMESTAVSTFVHTSGSDFNLIFYGVTKYKKYKTLPYVIVDKFGDIVKTSPFSSFGYGINSIASASAESFIFVGYINYINTGSESIASYDSIRGIVKINYDGTVNDQFDAGSGFNDNNVSVIINGPNNTFYVGGNFTTYSGSSANRIIRIHSNGSIDTSFNIGSGFNFDVRIITRTDDEKIFVYGGFSSYNGTSVPTLVRLNQNGTLDSSFIFGSANGSIYDMKSYQDKLYISGIFTSYSGSASYPGIVRLNSNGSIDTSFNTGMGTSPTNRFVTMAIRSDGKVLIAGHFTMYSGSIVNRIVQVNVDGTIDTSFNVGSGFNYDVIRQISVQPDGKCVITLNSSFIRYNSELVHKVVRLNSDGSLDSSYFDTHYTDQEYFSTNARDDYITVDSIGNKLVLVADQIIESMTIKMKIQRHYGSGYSALSSS